MSNNKNNPLSPEELFKLLDKKTNKDLNEMDEFEQEALEGFAALDNPEKVRKSVEEINEVISKKIAGDKGAQKNRIIWFSAAASIVLIILISIFFLNQTKEDSSTELALNEQTKKEEVASPDNQILDETAPAEAVNTAVKDKEKDLSAFQKGSKLSEKNVTEVNEPIENKPALAESQPVFGGGKEAKDEEQKSGELKNRSDNDGNLANTIVTADKLEVNKKSETVNEESELAQGYSIAQNTAKSQTEADDAKELRKEDSRNTDRAYKSKSKSNETIASSSVATKNTAAPAKSDNAEIAYYPGGEQAIKQFVLDHLKSKQYNAIIIGTYKIKATVSVAGNLKVNSIVQTTNENCKCTDKIKEALNTMTKWNSSASDGKSEVEFIIKF